MVNSGEYVKKRFSQTVGGNLKTAELHVIKEGSATISGVSYRGPSGTVMLNRNGVGVPLWGNQLSSKSVDNIKNLVILNARNRARAANDEISNVQARLVDPNDPNSKAIQSVIKEITYFGDNTKTLTDKSYRFFIDGGTVYFGEHGKIEPHMLLNPSEAKGVMTQFDEFLKNLHYNADANLLETDREYTKKLATKGTFDARKDEHADALVNRGIKKNSDLFKTEMKKWEESNQDLKKNAAIDPTKYIEYKVDNNGVVTKVEWANYTEYLLGDGVNETRREIEEIPLYSYLPSSVSESLEKSYLTPQVKNKYLILDKEMDAAKLETLEQLLKRLDEAKTKKTKKKKGETGEANNQANTLQSVLGATLKNQLDSKLFAFRGNLTGAATGQSSPIIPRFKYVDGATIITDFWDTKNTQVVTDKDIINQRTKEVEKWIAEQTSEDTGNFEDQIEKLVTENATDQFNKMFVLFDPPATVAPKQQQATGGFKFTAPTGNEGSSTDGKNCN